MLPIDATWSVDAPIDDPGAELTCSEVPTVSWEVTEEWTYTLGTFMMNLIAAPQPGDDHATIFFEIEDLVIGLDGRDGSFALEATIPEKENDGSTPAVGDANGVPGLEYVTTRWNDSYLYEIETDTWTTLDQPVKGEDEVVAFSDIDQDGIAEVVVPSASFALDGTFIMDFDGGLASTGAFLADVDGDYFPEILTSAGIWSPVDGTGVPWDKAFSPGYSFYGGTVSVKGATEILFQTGRGAVGLGYNDGSVDWILDKLPLSTYLSALGDTDGDGSPEICIGDGTQFLYLIDVEGNLLYNWDISASIKGGGGGGGCTMADLDGDGEFEVLAQSRAGLFIFDGATGDELLYSADYPTAARDSAPIVGDFDGDGSAEIALVTFPGIMWTASELVVLGPAKERWARTRPVWNQLAYDVTSIRDDGVIVGTPLPPSTTYGGVFRAQPAHDGDFADLESATTLTCDSVDTVVLDFAVHNLGSVEAPGGTMLSLRSFDGTTWSEVSSFTIKDAVPTGSVVEGTVTVAAADVGNRIVLEAVGTDTDCDVINDRSNEIIR